jgi:FlaA1/EpsC-like NDP-sugar epimerase
MKRYFMTVGEACILVLQAAALARGGEVFVLDMGEPIRILDLAREMIRLSGLEPETDIPIAITGIRPGEKLFEEYLTAEEGVDATCHQKIFAARITRDLAGEALAERLAELEGAAHDARRVKEILASAVPTYRPGSSESPAVQRGAASS